MGAITSCCQKDGAEDRALLAGEEGMEFGAVDTDEPHTADMYNQNLSPFTGLSIELKFTSKSSYEDKFVWLNSTSKTIHMSTHQTKEKRHKEASLTAVSSYIYLPCYLNATMTTILPAYNGLYNNFSHLSLSYFTPPNTLLLPL